MKNGKLIAIALCVAVLVVMSIGCDNVEENDVLDDEYSDVVTEVDFLDDETSEVENIPAQDQFASVDFEAAFGAFAPDTIMVRGGDFTVTWAQLYVYLFNAVNELLHSFDMGGEWSDVLFEDVTLGDVTLGRAIEEAVQYLIFEYGAYVSGVTLSDVDLNMLAEETEALVDMYGDVEELAVVLRAFGGFYSIELFESMIATQHLVEVLMDALFGVDATLFPDEDVAVYAEGEGYMMVKHIFRVKTFEGDNASLIELEVVLQELQEYDGDDIESFFETLMLEQSEDPGIARYPDGFLFQFPDMAIPFSQTSATLRLGEFSDIIETEFGYHIILRIPINYDVVPIGIENLGQFYTLRQLAASDSLSSLLQEWRNEMVLEFAPEFESINMADIFMIIRS